VIPSPSQPAHRPPPVVAVLGPTASGKSALGLELAERLGGEIICCDSMQVYCGMDIGTAKASAADRGAIRHHLLDVVSPAEQFHAAAWADAAHMIIGDMAGRERLPIIVGGTGLYFRALVRGLFQAPKPDAEIRARHQAEAAAGGTAAMHERLSAIDPEAAAKIHTGDLLRISRALEVFEQTGTTISELRRQKAPPPPPLRMFSVVLDFDLDLLRPRIAARVDAMMAAGFLDEVRRLREAGFAGARSMQALGYKQLGEFLDGKVDLDTAVAGIKTSTAAYARRQRTWFRSESINLRAYRPLVADPLARLIRGWLLT
jgi:tRNA dimethylallyltransferase